jgi:myo-inositol 2-dehydrogenase / D-chiro-inositol 1-dehydrogenase
MPSTEAVSKKSARLAPILGRMAAYSGQIVKWDDAINSQIDLTPKNLAWNAEALVKPDPDGIYACAMPGVTKPWS